MKYCILYLFLSFSILSCISINTIYVKKDHEIPREIREEIKPLTDSVYACFLNRNDRFIRQITIPDIVKDISIFDSIFKYCSFTEREQSDLEEQFLIRNSTGSNINKVISNTRNYEFYFSPKDGYTYISFKPILASDERSTYLIVCVFTKSNTSFFGENDDKWKLSAFGFGLYQHDGKFAIEYYNDAKGNYKQGNFLEAYYNMQIAYNLLPSGGPSFHYNKEKEIKDFADQVFSTVEEKNLLPFIITEIPTQPKIIKYSTVVPYGKLWSTLTYGTSINTKDTMSIKKECFEIGKAMEHYIPEMRSATDTIIYHAINIQDTTSKFKFIAPSK